MSRPIFFPYLLHTVGNITTPVFRFLSRPLLTRPTSVPSCTATQLRLMAHSNPSNGVSASLNNISQIINSHPSGGWERCWEEGVTPWDLGRTTPIVEHIIHTNSIPNGSALVPGCGSGYDVVALASPKRYAIGLDISQVAIRKARQLAASSQNANYCSFLLEDFFTWEPSELFDLIFDYTFFCAIEPNLQPAWASRMRDLLKPDGELITLIFPIDDHEGGPPYKVSVSDYEEVLHPVGFQATSIVDNELAVGARKGREKLGRWRKVKGASAL